MTGAEPDVAFEARPDFRSSTNAGRDLSHALRLSGRTDGRKRALRECDARAIRLSVE